ncbi:MAG TPA: hypothetical protein DCY88_34310 [Cyanobacteria bacterium UBA11372]|nr:hypothetical protein [Cyanobacteria bacterium UBA11372]
MGFFLLIDGEEDAATRRRGDAGNDEGGEYGEDDEDDEDGEVITSTFFSSSLPVFASARLCVSLISLTSSCKTGKDSQPINISLG